MLRLFGVPMALLIIHEMLYHMQKSKSSSAISMLVGNAVPGRADATAAAGQRIRPV